MSLRFRCGKCKQLILVDDRHYGKTVVCPSCNSQLKISDPRLAPPPDPLIGKKLAHYQIEAFLGEGGMAKVFRARNLSLNKTCALKILPEGFAEEDKSRIDRFIREAQSAANVEHPNVLPVHYVGKAGEVYFIEMQYVDGGTLENLLQQRGKLPPLEAARVVRDVAAGLGAAHDKGIIHRDIKPSNVMLMKDGQVRVADFGLAQMGEMGTRLTMSGMILGTPLYMSPEQGEGKGADHRSDIYSLGIMSYQLLTGTPPYTADTPVGLIHHHIYTPLPDIMKAAPDVPPALGAIVSRMTAKMPQDRYQGCDEICRDLDALLNSPENPAGISPGTLRLMAQTVQAKPKRRSLLPIALTILAALGLAGAGLVYIVKQRTSQVSVEGPRTVQTPSEGPAKFVAASLPSPVAQQPASGVQIPAAQPIPAFPVPEARIAKPLEARPKTEVALVAPKPPVEPTKPPALEKPPREAADRARFDALVADLDKLVASRNYEEALDKCRDALKDSRFAGFDKELANWDEAVQSCRRVMDRARRQAKEQVGKKYQVEIKTGARGRVRVAGEVLRFGDDTLYIQIGEKEMPYKLNQLGPTEVVRLASEGGTPTTRYRLDQAVLLFAEGCESEGLSLARAAEEAAAADQALRNSAKATIGFLTGWADRRKHEERERQAAQLARKIASDYEARKWKDALEGAETLKKGYEDADVYKKESEKLLALVEKAREGQVLEADRAKRFSFWKFIGPKVPVLTPGGQVEELIAGYPKDIKCSPDGKYIAIAHSFGVDLWDPQKAVVVRRLDAHPREVVGIDFSADGSRLLSGSEDGLSIVWEVATGKPLARFDNAARNQRAVALSPDGTQAASSSGSDAILRDVKSGEVLAQLRGHGKFIHAMQFSPDGARLATAGDDSTIRIWDHKKGIQVACLESRSVGPLAFSPDGKLLASAGGQAKVTLWDALSNQKKDTLDLRGRWIKSLDFNKDGSLLAAAGDVDGGVVVMNLIKRVEVSHGSASDTEAVSFTPDGKYLAYIHRCGGTPTVLQAQTGRPVQRLRDYGWWWRSVSFSPVDRNVLLGSRNVSGGAYFLYDVGKSVELKTWGGDANDFGAVLTRDGTGFLGWAGGNEPGLCLRDLRSSKTFRTLVKAQKDDKTRPFALSADNSRLAFVADPQTIRVVDFETGRTVADVKRQDHRTHSLALSPDGKTLAAAENSLGPNGTGSIRVWDVGPNQAERCVLNRRGKVACLVFSADGKLLASSEPSGICLWPVQGLAANPQAQVLSGFWGWSETLAFTPDGEQLISGDGLNAIKVWDLKTGRAIQTLTNHRDRVTGISLSADGRTMASSSHDGSIGLWRRGIMTEAQPTKPKIEEHKRE